MKIAFSKPVTANGPEVTETASTEIEMSLATRIGLDGKSAYEIAVSNGFEGNEDEWVESLREPAEKAAQEVRDIAGELTCRIKELEEKIGDISEGGLSVPENIALIDEQSGYIAAEQLDPLHGIKTGVETPECFYSSRLDLLDDTDQGTFELLFTTPSDIETQQVIAIIGGTLEVSVGSGNVTVSSPESQISTAVYANTANHLVISDGENPGIFFNGAFQESLGASSYRNAIFILGADLAGQNNFSGIIHRVRIFKNALSEGEVSRLWNNGRPDKNTISQSEKKAGPFSCVAEFIPSGLLETKWRDTSVNGNDLSCTGKSYESYVEVAHLDKIRISTGRFTHSIYSSPKTIPVPAGYMPESIVVNNYNELMVYDFKVATKISKTTLCEVEELILASYGYQYIFNPENTVMAKGEILNITADGNGNKYGMEITVIFAWCGTL